jgi:hypothetical protein
MRMLGNLQCSPEEMYSVGRWAVWIICDFTPKRLVNLGSKDYEQQKPFTPHCPGESRLLHTTCSHDRVMQFAPRDSHPLSSPNQHLCVRECLLLRAMLERPNRCVSSGISPINRGIASIGCDNASERDCCLLN